MTDEGQRGSGETQITSIADAVLKLKELRESNKNINEPDVEEQFARLSLAFKTDQFTLSQRLDLQKRQRDNAEKNIDCEVKSLRESLNALNQLCTDSEMREVITKTQQHVDIVQQTTMRMSSRAETYGAIQQEKRMNCAFETMLSYVEHLKLLYDKEHMELEEYKKLLAEHHLLPGEKGSIDGGEDKRVLPPRSQSLSSSSRPDVRPRLLSAVCLLNTNSDLPRTSNGTVILNPSLSPKSRRCSCPVGPMTPQINFNNVNVLPAFPADVCAPDIVSSIKEMPRCDETGHDSTKGPSISITTTTLDSEGNIISEGVLASPHDSKGNNDMT